MTTETKPSLEQKLKNLRRILWVVFAAVSLPAVMLIVLANFFLGNTDPDILGSGTGTMLPTLLLALGIAFSIAAIGAVCLAVYFVLKYRLERDDGIFL